MATTRRNGERALVPAARRRLSVSPARRPRGGATTFAVTDHCRPRTSRAFLARVVAAALAHVGRPDLAVSLLLTGDRVSARLHGEFFGDASPTDVMSFPLGDAVEIAVNVARARRVARQHRHAVRAEIALYVVHGILHATGHDDRQRRDRARMRAAECAVLGALGLRVARVDA